MKSERYEMVDELVFKNRRQRNLSFDEVFQNIVDFIKKEPSAKYRLMIGTDAQVHGRYTKFVTGIMIYKEGKGGWVCNRKVYYPRKITNLHEKISTETSLTEEIAFLLTPEKREELFNIVLPYVYKGSDLILEGHIDVGDGPQNATRLFVNEMSARIKAVGLEPLIKPYSVIASGYANRESK